MKTTVDIPEPLYKQAKIRAVETGQTLRQLVLISLSRELGASPGAKEPRGSYWANRKLLPEYERAMKEGTLRPKPGDRDVTNLISEDRDAR
jgi:hypothetical protein